MKNYLEYLSEVEFEFIPLKELNVEVLTNLEAKQGLAIDEKIYLSIMRKFEPLKILNIVEIFEKVDVFIVIDPFGITIYEGTVSEAIEFVQGFYDVDDQY